MHQHLMTEEGTVACMATAVLGVDCNTIARVFRQYLGLRAQAASIHVRRRTFFVGKTKGRATGTSVAQLLIEKGI